VSNSISHQDLNVQVQTVNATPLNAFAYTIPANTAVMIKARVIARSAGGDVGMWELMGATRRASSTASIVGTVLDLLSPRKDLGAALWDATIKNTGNDVYIELTGALVATIDWLIVVDIVTFTP
jgi:hypothetical protein